MPIEARIVSDSSGKTEGTYIPTGSTTAVSIVGTIQAKDVYTFYAVTTSQKEKQEITIVLPVGGAVSGLYRFPRVGEKVLVSNETSGKFLLGYIPSEGETQHSLLPFTADELPKSSEVATALAKKEADRTQSEKDIISDDLKAKEKFVQNEKDKLLEERQGMILRYQQTGKKEDKVAAGEEYSEIGFYRKPTQWVPKDTDRDKYQDYPPARDSGELDAAYSSRLVSAGFAKNKDELETAHINRVSALRPLPHIDHINIQSTGDIKSTAVNHHLIKGKRLEILADCNWDEDHGKNARDHGDLDRPGDDSEVHEGDVHIRAKKRIVIKAGDEIIIQVGRSSIVITGDGIVIKSKKSHANIENSYDSAISVSALAGISLAATSIGINAVFSASMGDAMGGSIDATGGIVRISGKDVQLTAFNLLQYKKRFVSYTLNFINNLGSIIAGLAGGDTDAALGLSTNKFPSLIGKIGPSALNFLMIQGPTIWTAISNWWHDLEKKTPLDNAADMAITIFTAARAISSIAFTILDSTVDLMAGGDRDKANTIRDSLALASVVADYGISIIAFGGIVLASVKASAVHKSDLRLSASADAFLVGFQAKVLSTNEEDAQGPLVAVQSASVTTEKPSSDDDNSIELDDLGDDGSIEL